MARMDYLFINVVCLLITARAVDSISTKQTEQLCGEDAVLTCTASPRPGVLYRSMIWYKVTGEPSEKLTGLLMKKLTQNNDTVLRYKSWTRHVELSEDSLDLFLPNVTAEDTGKYRCFMAAPVGHQNQEGDVLLTVYGCPESRRKDTLYLVCAIVLLVVALLLFTISYVCLRNTLHNSKKLFKTSHQSKDLIYTMDSKQSGSKIFPEVCV
ncbi:CD83 antigen [Chanos chanos]|uniref:CD83 antigen n=1 Tax=Chanos chanos TaxID=29144 RepID=A0A6J2W2L7_CHACN|nr:CD83 antigen [Chanos chanos]